MIRQRCLLTFKSVHYRLTAQEILSNLGILVEVVPVPPNIRTDCDKALELDCQHQPRVIKILSCYKVCIEKIIKVTNEKETLLERFREKSRSIALA
jgi:hypothetical protein